MAFLGVKELYELQNNENIIEPFDESRIKNAAYELSLGGEVYLTDSKSGKVELLNESNRGIDINPGQFALLLTKEKIKIPKNKIAFISIKASVKLKGLVNVSGFHVDPGFDDHLIFSVYNAGPSPILMTIGEPYFPIWFAELTTELNDDEAYNKNNNHFNKLTHIPPTYIEFLKRGELASPKAILDKVKEVETSLNEKIIQSNEKKERNDWLYKILIGLLIAIALKTLWDWGAYDRGYNDCKNAKTATEQIATIIQGGYVDSLLKIKLDSIVNIQLPIHDTAK